MGGEGLVYAKSTPTGSKVILKTDVVDPIQILFQIGVYELAKGNYSSAIEIFEAIRKKTNEPRVQLELARALFLDHRYREAEKEFQGVLQQPDIPWSVQENIRSYLEEIDSVFGFIKFRFSLVSDSNPRNFTDSRQVQIGGQPLKIVPPDDNKEIIGVRYSANGAKALTEDGSLMGYLNASYSDFESSIFDRWSADLGLFLTFRSLPKVKIRAGIEESYYANRHLYEFPYLGFILTPQPVYQFRMNSELKIGRLRVPSARHLDAMNLSLTTKLTKPLTKETHSSGDIYLEKSISDEDAYSYYGGSVGLGLSFSIVRNWNLKSFVSVGRRLYEANDPFFGDTRRDTRYWVGITITKGDFKVFGYTPEMVVSYEENRSNLAFYSYDKLGLVLSFN